MMNTLLFFCILKEQPEWYIWNMELPSQFINSTPAIHKMFTKQIKFTEISPQTNFILISFY